MKTKFLLTSKLWLKPATARVSKSTKHVFKKCQPTIPKSDDFKGYLPVDVAYLALLNDNKAPSPLQMEQIRLGCTCGECIASFISPRMAFALERQGAWYGHMFSEDSNCGIKWLKYNSDLLGHLLPHVRVNMGTNKSMRKGFTNLFRCVAKTIAAKKLPLTEHVMQQIYGEWPPVTKVYLERRGTVAAVVLAIFNVATGQDEYLGDGDHFYVFRDEIEELKECRNDHKFVFARRQYCRAEGHPVKDNP